MWAVSLQLGLREELVSWHSASVLPSLGCLGSHPENTSVCKKIADIEYLFSRRWLQPDYGLKCVH